MMAREAQLFGNSRTSFVIIRTNQQLRFHTCLYKELVANSWVVHIVYCGSQDDCKRLQIRHHVLNIQIR